MSLLRECMEWVAIKIRNDKVGMNVLSFHRIKIENNDRATSNIYLSERYPEQLAGQLTHLIPSPGKRLERCRWGVENFWQV